jgi:hypothetical protein
MMSQANVGEQDGAAVASGGRHGRRVALRRGHSVAMWSSGVSAGTLGTGFGPALGGKIRGDAGGEEPGGDSERADDPRQLDAALEHEVVQDAEDEDKDGGLRKEAGAAARGDEQQREGSRRLLGGLGRRRWRVVVPVGIG